MFNFKILFLLTLRDVHLCDLEASTLTKYVLLVNKYNYKLLEVKYTYVLHNIKYTYKSHRIKYL